MLNSLINNDHNEIVYKVNDEKLSYDELIKKATKYGELLKRQGNSPVIIYGSKTINTFIAIFSCLYAKRAYVPIDSSVPIKRVKQIIKLTETTLILTDNHLPLENITQLSLQELVMYKNDIIKNNYNDIAYIIFTSGSTGIPKGVPISYNNLFNFINWINSIEPLNKYQGINVLNQASFSFDLSVADIYYTISNGHTLIGLTKENQLDYEEMFKIMVVNEINVLVITPTFIKLCLVNQEFDAKHFPSIKAMYFCGEQLDVNTVKKISMRFPEVSVINAYGPTEATSAVSAILINKNMLDDEILPCGNMKNLATELILKNGEIILKGNSVFSGYLGSCTGGYYQENGNNCFKTGDLGYVKNDMLYCKGRLDNQVKYKGYRIELNDIENNIYKIKGIKQCAVVAKYDDNMLVKMIKAFIVLDEGYNCDYVKVELEKLLPKYMIPKQFINMIFLPVNNNGKIDRKKLMSL